MNSAAVPPSPLKLDLMPRADFAALALHDKNAYLQQLADQFATLAHTPPFVLSKDALARLRRFYVRRSFADLKIEALPDDPLNQVLRRLGETIKAADRSADILGVLRVEAPAPVLRAPPPDDAQLSFFVPVIYDAPIKDDMNLMDVAPFSLSKSRRNTAITYQLKDSIITISGSAEHGIATAFDYDIFIHMVSFLNEQVRRYKIELKKGLRPTLPARLYRPNTSHILKFCRRNSGGKQYRDMEAALDRLNGTQIKIVNLAGGNRREVVGRSLIDSYRVISKTTSGNIDQVEIGIPDWVYNTIVRDEGLPQILTINPDYFLISQSIGRVLYRLARKAAGKTDACYGFSEIHKRSGSSQTKAQFAYELRRFVDSTNLFQFPDYDLSIRDGQNEPVLVMRWRPQPAAPAMPAQGALEQI